MDHMASQGNVNRSMHHVSRHIQSMFLATSKTPMDNAVFRASYVDFDNINAQRMSKPVSFAGSIDLEHTAAVDDLAVIALVADEVVVSLSTAFDNLRSSTPGDDTVLGSQALVAASLGDQQFCHDVSPGSQS